VFLKTDLIAELVRSFEGLIRVKSGALAGHQNGVAQHLVLLARKRHCLQAIGAAHSIPFSQR
jgi:hypothetical protein